MTTRYDVVVVGAGFAGSLVAKHLGGRGWRVLVIEAGMRSSTSDGWQEHQDAVRSFQLAVTKVPSAPYRSSAAAPSPDVRDLSGAEGHLVQNGALPYASTYLRVNGGSGLAWTGLTPRMHPEDFHAGTPGRNWPIGYADIEPYYRVAEREIGVAGDADEQRECVGLPIPDDYVFPMYPIPRSYLDEVIADAVDGQHVKDPNQAHPTELRVVTTPHGRNSAPNPLYNNGKGYQPVGGRCVGYASCMPICPEQAKYTPLVTQARWPASVTLITEAVVSRVLAAANGRVTGVEYHSRDRTTHTVDADIVVLAAHAIQNATLLLFSGLANRSDQVGRNLMDHPVLLTWGLMPSPIGPYRGPGSTSGIEAFRFGPARARRAPFRIEIGNWGWVWAQGPPDLDVAEVLRTGDPAAPNGTGLFGAELRQVLGDRVGRQFALQFEMEQPADPANRVTIDPRHLDRAGHPRPVLTYDLSDHVKRGIASAKAVSDQIFALLGAEDHSAYRPGMPGYFEYEGEPYAYWGAGHGGGTHIMGDSPANSVVDHWQRCWDHRNLYAVGCGSMPSLGTSNPSLTMAALALRSAEQIHRDLLTAHQPSTLSVHAEEPSPR